MQTFDTLFEKKLAGESVDMSEYSASIDALADVVTAHFDNILRSLHGTSWSLAPAVMPLVYLAIYQRAAARAFGSTPRSSPLAKETGFDTLEDLMRSNAGDPAGQLLAALREAPDPLTRARQLAPLPMSGTARWTSGTLPDITVGRPDRVSLSVGLTGMERLRLKLSNPSMHGFRARGKPSFSLDWVLRRQMLDDPVAAPDKLVRSARELVAYLSLMMPTYLLEGFAATLRRLHRSLGKTHTLVFSIEFCRKPEVALAFAYIKARQGLLIGCQHGGLYGQTDPTWPERVENRLSDIYLTWGYKHSDKQWPMPSIRLSRQRYRKEKHREAPDELLLVAPYLKDSLELGIHSPSAIHQIDALNRSLGMLEPLLSSGQRVVLRCHPRNTESELQPLLPLLAHPNLRVLEGRRGELSSDCRAYQFTLFSSPNATGLAELAAENIPFRIIAQANDFWIQSGSQPVYRSLMDSGIWVTEGPLRAEQVDAAAINAAEQAALRAFTEQFACHSDRYLQAWSTLFKQAGHRATKEHVVKAISPFSEMCR